MTPTQGQQSTIDSSIEVINVENESLSNVNSQASLNNVVCPAVGRFSNHTVSSGSPAFLSSNARNVQSLNGWSSGEPSSRFGSQVQMNEVGSKMDNGFSSDGFRADSTSAIFPGRICFDHDGDALRNGSFFLHGSSSNQIPRTINLNAEIGNSSHGLKIGESSSGSSSQAGEDSGGGSYKRKASEGASGNFYSNGTSGCLSQYVNDVWHSGSSQFEASRSLSLSTPPQDFPNIGSGLAAMNAYPSMRDVESSGRPFDRRLIPGQVQEASPFSWPASLFDPVNASSRAYETPPNTTRHPDLMRNIHQVSWNGASSSRTRNFSSIQNPGERFNSPWDDINPRSLPRNNPEHPMFAPVTEMRNPVHDQSIGSFAHGNSSSSNEVPLGSRPAASPAVHYFHPTPAWGTPVSSSMHNLQRLSELAPWSSFPSTEPDTASQVGSFSFLPWGPVNSSTEVAAIPSGHSSRGHHRPRPRRSGLLLERQSDDSLHMRHFGRSIGADNDGRHRLISEIRQVLTAMRRGENLRAEDHVVFDPLIYHGMAEMYDRHRDMRLDVDNMSYEELLALGERIGDVSTGLGEETIMKNMKQRKFGCGSTEFPQDVEPCCVCQEEYNEGDDVGRLECGHDFHADCIKQWLMLKNICPICKTTGLPP